MTTTTTARKLKNLRITEISLVDNPANPGAAILLHKRDGRSGQTLVEAARRLRERTAPVQKRGAADPRSGALAVLRRAREGVGKADAGAVPVRAEVSISGVEADKRFIGGFASVIEIDGRPVTDSQNDVISEDELVQSAHEFIRSHRAGKLMHGGDAGAIEYTESLVFTKEVQKALGIDLGKVGWWVGGFVRDGAVWKRVKSGELRALSIGGTAVREA